MGTKRIAEKIHGIRKALGYATKKQIKEGAINELKTIERVEKSCKKYRYVSTGGFQYHLSDSGKTMIITPDFVFKYRIKKKVRNIKLRGKK